MKILLGKRRKFYETNLRQKISKPKELYLPPSLIFLLNLKLRPTLTIMQCQNLLTLHYCHNRTQLLEASPEKISILKGLYPSKAAENYHPISLLPLLSKIIKSIVHDQTGVIEFLYRFSIEEFFSRF